VNVTPGHKSIDTKGYCSLRYQITDQKCRLEEFLLLKAGENPPSAPPTASPAEAEHYPYFSNRQLQLHTSCVL